jgi:hypothetical protein
MWDDFWRAIIFVALLSAVVASCSCAMSDDKPTVIEVIGAIKDACGEGNVEELDFENKKEGPAVKSGSCYQEYKVSPR